MNRITRTKHVNLDQEVAAMAEHLASRWEGISSPLPLLTMVRDAALHASRGQFHCTSLLEPLWSRESQREKKLEAKFPDTSYLASLYDQPSRMMSAVRRNLTKVERIGKVLDGNSYYWERVDALCAKVISAYPAFEFAKPLGWDALQLVYDESEGMDQKARESLRSDRDAYQGHYFIDETCKDFPLAVHLYEVMYLFSNQRWAPTRSLVTAVYGYFLQLGIHCNTLAVQAEFKLLDWNDAHTDLVFEVDLKAQHPLLKTVLRLAYDEAFEEPSSLKAKYEAAIAYMRQPQATSTTETEDTLSLSLPSEESRKATKKEEEAQVLQYLREAFAG